MKKTTLTDYILRIQEQKNKEYADILPCIIAIENSAIQLAHAINQASIENAYGTTGEVNIQGEQVQILDSFADSTCINALRMSGVVAGVVTEEQEHAVIFEEHATTAPYVVAIDPLDGSSNIDTNNSIGTIFCVFKRTTPNNERITEKDFLQNSSTCLCAGYIMYGPATILVLTLGEGVYSFTLNKKCSTFVCTNTTLTIPINALHYSVNEGYCTLWDSDITTYLNNIKHSIPHYCSRYVGSLVADIHRTLLKGGIFLYPTQYNEGKSKNKLRLLFECIPIAKLIEDAGGCATNGSISFNEICPSHIHERSAFFAGSHTQMKKFMER